MVAQSVPSAPGNAQAAKQFEGMLMAFVFQQMRQTVQPSGLFGNDGIARSTYEYLLDQAVSSSAMDAGKGWGLSQQLQAKWDAAGPKHS
jgi:Rod binding domain-containing protein